MKRRIKILAAWLALLEIAATRPVRNRPAPQLRETQAPQPPPPNPTILEFPPSLQQGIDRIAKALDTANVEANANAQRQQRAMSTQSAQEIAHWTLLIELIGGGIAALGLVSTIVLAFTLASARRTSRQIGRAIKAIEQWARLDLRAYVSVEPGGINRVASPHSEAVGVVRVKNLGKLPAQNVSIVITTTVRPSSEFDPDGIADEHNAQLTIQPGAEIRECGGESVQIEEVKHREKSTFVWGTVWYSDGSGFRRYTRFCHRYSGADYGHTDWSARSPIVVEPEKGRYHARGNDSN